MKRLRLWPYLLLQGLCIWGNLISTLPLRTLEILVLQQNWASHFLPNQQLYNYTYSFESGDQLIQAVLKDPGNLFGGFDIYNLEGTDKFGIKAVLEKRTGDMVTIIAEAEFESDQEIETMTELNMELQYLSDDDPTHFHISFSPSVDGGMFKGASRRPDN